MEKNKRWVYFMCLLMPVLSCKKSEFLAVKPSIEISQPTTLNDLQQLLENTQVTMLTGGLGQVAADDNDLSYAALQSVKATERNAYLWNKDTYGGDVAIQDWNANYQEIFYANVVLETLAKSDSASTAAGQYLKGWALFTRAFSSYDLTRLFCKAYDKVTANNDPGIPLRNSSAIDYMQPRSSLQQSIDQILSDLDVSISLLPSVRPSSNLNRPTKMASYALLSRIYLDMRNYSQAENYADKSLDLYSALIDYNTVSKTSATPFSLTNAELICNKIQAAGYTLTLSSASSAVKISPALISLYAPDDLRLKVYFGLLADGSYHKKRGYSGTGLYPFTGLATDELYLIKAECLARRGQQGAALDKLNSLIIKRFDNTKVYTPISADSPSEALNKILLERRKELVWRGLRWHDLKRLNKEGLNITLTRNLNGITYTLPPNDPRYVFPIPDDEIALSGIQQNLR